MRDSPVPGAVTGSMVAGRDSPRGDDGTILVLTLGFAGILLVVVGIVVNVSSVILAKRAVASAADGAALSAVQALDLDRLYAGGIGAAVPLSPGEAATRVELYRADAARTQPGLRMTVRLDGDGAVVTAVRTVRPPFPVLGTGPVEVTSVARARAPVVAP